MTDQITISPNLKNKEERYLQLMPQLKALVQSESDWIANTANMTAALKEAMNFFWIGCYRVAENELLLGPFQGPVACTRIAFGKGVCGTSWAQRKTIVVSDVEQFPGHIACSSLSKSEIVIPVIKDEKVVMVIDVDSDKYDDFDQIDVFYLEQVAGIIAEFYEE
jgi:GAF domain-containing protein